VWLEDVLNIIFLLSGIFVFSLLLTSAMIRYAISKELLDIPNARSSHVIPTPRGGGIAIVTAFMFGLTLLWAMSHLENRPFIALSGAGLWIAIIGFIDDHDHIAARWRLLAHFSAAVWLVYWLSGLPPLIFFGSVFDMGWFGYVLAVIALVWLLNLFNFLDGIDGIAGIEAISSTLVAGLLFLFVFDHESMGFVYLLMSAAVAGFLVWNFPPAKIFMGDAGSGFLGLMLGAFALHSAHVVPQMLWVWLILLGVFVVDATYTLIRRLLRGDKIYEAHRSHAYQYASRRYCGHLPVTLAVLVINLFWLAPWAFVVATGSVDGVVAIACSYAPLLLLAWYFNAGELDTSQVA